MKKLLYCSTALTAYGPLSIGGWAAVRVSNGWRF